MDIEFNDSEIERIRRRQSEGTRIATEGLNALVAWWESNRPVAWNEQQHYANPTVNCNTDAEKRAALAAAEVVRMDREVERLKAKNRVQ